MSNIARILIWSSFALPAVATADDCDVRAPRSAQVDGSGVTKIVLEAAAGDLRVRGGSSSSIDVRGEACAPTRRRLDEIKLETRREGATVYVRVVIPDDDSIFGRGRLDLTIDAPASVALDVNDSSGDVEIHGVSAVKLDDSSGDIGIEDITGQVQVEDSSGDIRVKRVRGDVSASDSSGDVIIEDVSGNVAIPVDSSGDLVMRRIQGGVRVMNDSSGDIRIADVGKNVVVDNDSSGSIKVENVTGDLTVAHDSSGDIRHSHVMGAVSIPKDRDD